MNDWIELNSGYTYVPYKMYRYVGTGYFPEVVSRLEDKIGKVLYKDIDNNIIHVKVGINI